jgi:hypothetical protein
MSEDVVAKVSKAIERAKAEDEALAKAVEYIQAAWAEYIDTGENVPGNLVVRRWLVWTDYDVSKIRDAVLHAAALCDDDNWDFDQGIADIEQFLYPVDVDKK